MYLPKNDSAWVIATNPGVLIRHWGNSFVAYNIASGDTHQLGVLAGCIVEHLKITRMTKIELLEKLGSDASVNDMQFCEILESTLADLENLGLIAVHPA